MKNIKHVYLHGDGVSYKNYGTVITYEDERYLYRLPELIKSNLENSSTLLNARAPTNFYFKLTGKALTSSEIIRINNINSAGKIRDRVQALYRNGASLEFIKTQSTIFQNNLILIDSLLPNILSHSLIAYYKEHMVSLSDICSYLTKTNPLNFDQSSNHKFYEHKLKRFLSEIALGMMPNTIWTGEYDGTEGYIVVKDNGDVVCYHIINRNLFEDYLLANTKFDTPSSGRHDFGQIFTENGEEFFKLNFQIRFN